MSAKAGVHLFAAELEKKKDLPTIVPHSPCPTITKKEIQGPDSSASRRLPSDSKINTTMSSSRPQFYFQPARSLSFQPTTFHERAQSRSSGVSSDVLRALVAQAPDREIPAAHRQHGLPLVLPPLIHAATRRMRIAAQNTVHFRPDQLSGVVQQQNDLAPDEDAMTYEAPEDAAASLEFLRTAQEVDGRVAALQRLSAMRDNQKRGDGQPVPGDDQPTYADVLAAVRSEEVYALPPGHPLPSLDQSCRCGTCRRPLRWGLNLPSRCQWDECRTLNIGDDWVANERFRQAEASSRLQAQINDDTKNYLGEQVTQDHDELERWRKTGCKPSEDPVRWDDFLNMDMVDEEGADTEGGQANVTNQRPATIAAAGGEQFPLPNAPSSSAAFNQSNSQTVAGHQATTATVKNDEGVAHEDEDDSGFVNHETFDPENFSFTEALNEINVDGWGQHFVTAATGDHGSSDNQNKEPATTAPAYNMFLTETADYSWAVPGVHSGPDSNVHTSVENVYNDEQNDNHHHHNAGPAAFSTLDPDLPSCVYASRPDFYDLDFPVDILRHVPEPDDQAEHIFRAGATAEENNDDKYNHDLSGDEPSSTPAGPSSCDDYPAPIHGPSSDQIVCLPSMSPPTSVIGENGNAQPEK